MNFSLALLHVFLRFCMFLHILPAKRACMFSTKSSEFVLLLRLFAFMQNVLIYVLMAWTIRKENTKK